MKLLLLLSATVRGGAEEYALTIGTAAAQAGWSVQAAFPETAGTATLVQDFTRQSVQYHRLDIADRPSRSIAAAQSFAVYLVRTLALLRKLKPDVVLINLPWADHCLGSIVACGLLNLPTAVMFHLIPPTKIPLSRQRLKAYTWARRRHQQWMTNSQHNCKLIAELFHLPPGELLYIYNGTVLPTITQTLTDRAALDLATLRDRVRQELNLPPTSRLILTIGRLVPQKGYADLIPIIPRLIQEFPDVRFVWLGDGEQRQVLQAQLKENQIDDRVLMLGYRSDLPRFLQAADLFLFPTQFEGHPFAILEAMAYSLPIVAADASSIPEIIQHQIHGLLFRTGDREDMLETVRWALQHPEPMQQLAQRAQQRVRDFSQASMIEKTLSVLKNLTISKASIQPSVIH